MCVNRDRAWLSCLASGVPAISKEVDEQEDLLP